MKIGVKCEAGKQSEKDGGSENKRKGKESENSVSVGERRKKTENRYFHFKAITIQ